MEQFYQHFILNDDQPALKAEKKEETESSPNVQTHSTGFFLNPQAFQIPHPQKQDKGGEDAYFISSDGKGLGVADGVGGWVTYGVDPALYSRHLMEEAKRAYDEYHLRHPQAVLEFAYNHMNDIQGSTTACAAVLQGNLITISNLGDSGCLIVRKGKVLFRTKEQQHIFNFPVQLGTGHSTTPKDADNTTLQVEEGDLILLATDGLFDNLYDHEIIDIIREYQANNSAGSNLAQVLCERAFVHADSSTIETPFTRHAFELGYLQSPFGGKLDDITVIVAKVVPQPPTTTSL